MTVAPVSAQTPQAGVGDIIVTAQKREQAVNKVGMTIQAATADTLQQRGITSPADLMKIVPGFTYTESLFVSNCSRGWQKWVAAADAF